MWAWVLLAVIVVAAIALVVVVRRLVRSLGRLATAVERIEQGDLGARVEPGKRRGEVAVLERGFNRMAISLEERQHQIELAERAARESEERLRLMIEVVTDYAIFLVDLDGGILSWNSGGVRLLGYDTDEAIGQDLDEILFVHERSPDPLALAAREGRAQLEGWCVRSDGTAIWTRTVVTALRDEQGNDAQGYVIILQDLTDHQAAKEAMEEALRLERTAAMELRHAADLKDEFLAIAAHEIRTPLSAILGATQVLSEGEDSLSEDERRQFNAIIEACATDMRDIVERLLDFTRLQAGHVRFVPRSFDLQRAIESHLALVGRHLEDRQVVVDVAAGEVRTDPDLLRHVVTNLVSNAGKFSPAGSTIAVEARSDGEVLHVVVRDEGVGIAADDHERIFELFRQSSGPGIAASGTGVGLAIVKRYVELVGGQIELESAPGKGSAFAITIPLSPPAPEDG